MQAEGHDGFPFDGSVVDVDVGNVGEADQGHDVAHAENLDNKAGDTIYNVNVVNIEETNIEETNNNTWMGK